MALLLALAAPAIAADWETTRKNGIDPLNTGGDRHLPSAVKNRDLAAIVAMYATDTGGGLGWDGARGVYPGRGEKMRRWEGPAVSEPIRDRYRRLLDLLTTVDKAELRIDRIDWD